MLPATIRSAQPMLTYNSTMSNLLLLHCIDIYHRLKIVLYSYWTVSVSLLNCHWRLSSFERSKSE